MEYFDRFAIPHPSPAIYASMVAIGLTMIAILFGLTYFKKWGYLWREWLTTVDHKKIGIMYLIAALIMLFRGGVDAIMMRAQTAVPDNKLLDAQHYNEVFTTHGVVMIIFMAMPFIYALMNFVVPLQIGARDVAFPRLNALSFWLFFMGAMLFNISFVVGGSPDAGWTSYFPLAGNDFSQSVGTNYYMLAIQIAGIGTLISGINFTTTILKMRVPNEIDENANVHLDCFNHECNCRFRISCTDNCASIGNDGSAIRHKYLYDDEWRDGYALGEPVLDLGTSGSLHSDFAGIRYL